LRKYQKCFIGKKLENLNLKE